jgi:hypothetical protein
MLVQKGYWFLSLNIVIIIILIIITKRDSVVPVAHTHSPYP